MSESAHILVFSAKGYDIESFNRHNQKKKYCKFTFIPETLTKATFKKHAKGVQVDGVCVFVNDTVDAAMLDYLKKKDVLCVLNRCAGFDRVDVKHADKIGIQVCRVPAYSPYAVAEHAVSLLVCLNRKLHLANNRTSSGNFSIDGLTGMDLYGKTVGVIGTGKIGQILIDILTGFGCKIAAYDVYINETYKAKPNVTYMELDELYAKADVISVHSPLLPSTKHMINKTSISKMKDGVVIINCARGGLINTNDVLDGIGSGKVGGLGIDVYENEAGVFFSDCSSNMQAFMKDKTLAALMGCPQVLISGHQAFLTTEALDAIAMTTITNVKEVCFREKKGKTLTNWVAPEMATSG